MPLNFTSMVPKKSYEHVVEQIQEAIFEGRIKAGERLPSEMKLKDTFNTSRGTVREALRVLEQKGLVSIRTGVKGGAVIRPANTRALREGVELMIRHKKVSLGQLAEFRAWLEGYAARKAAENSDRSGSRNLKDILEEIRVHVESGPGDWELFHQLDARFHQQVAVMADNPLVLANLTAIHENIHVYFHTYLPFSPGLLEEDFNDLCRIAMAVEQGDGDTAEKAARHHIVKFSRVMEGQAG